MLVDICKVLYCGMVTVLVDICVKYFIVDGMVTVLVDICVKYFIVDGMYCVG